MLLNAARGDQALSVSAAELTEAWRIFTPILHQIDAEKPPPVVHKFGELPEGYVEWARQHGIDIAPTPWAEKVSWGAREAEKHAAECRAAYEAAAAAAEAAATAEANAEAAKTAEEYIIFG